MRSQSSHDEVTTLQQFYDLMAWTATVRRRMVAAFLEGGRVDDGDIELLRRAHEVLRALPGSPAHASVRLDQTKSISLDLGYEVGELEKDIVFFTRGEEHFYGYLAGMHEAFEAEVRRGVAMLRGVGFRTLVSDRDGTVNNYCGRYLSSIQSAYNAVFLSRFARACVVNAVILTSAPLADGGLVDIGVAPMRHFIYAGSKGREYLSRGERRGSLAIPREQQATLAKLNARLATLLEQPRYATFALIGSGFQRKFGQTTLSRQDISGSIPPKESAAFLATLRGVVDEIDPAGEFFRIEDTGLDVEIMLTVKSGEAAGGVKDFDKADGVLFLDRELGLDLAAGPNLICGDTPSDVPMISASMSRTKRTWAAFVSDKPAVRDDVSRLCPDTFLTNQPDVLVTVFNELAKNKEA
jgi:hypothetical protein